MRISLIAAIAGVCFISSGASAGEGEKKNIEHLARMTDANLKVAATMAGNVNGVMQRCPALRPGEDARTFITVPVLLYDGVDKHLTSNPSKLKWAIRIYESSFAQAANRRDSCQAEKAKYPGLYR